MIHALDGNNNDQLVNILNPSVERKKRSNNYKCPHCDKHAIVNKGKIKKYFSHKGKVNTKNDCSALQGKIDPELFQAESIVHYLAKEVFKEEKNIFVQEYTINSIENCDLDNQIFPKLTYKIPKEYFSIVENSIEVETYNNLYRIKPDLNCLIEFNGEKIPLLIEIAVEHSCHDSSDKKEKINNNSLNCIEIDLKNLHEKYQNIKQLVNSEVSSEDLSLLEEKIKNAIKDKLRYETINFSTPNIEAIKLGLNEQYKLNLKEHNNIIIAKRKEIYKYALLNNQLEFIDINKTGQLYQCICCQNSLIIHNNDFKHDNCYYLNGYGVTSIDYFKKYIVYKIFDALKKKTILKTPTLKSFLMSQDNLKLINSIQHKVNFFYQKQYDLLSTTILDSSIILIKIKDINNNELSLLFYFNSNNELENSLLETMRKNNTSYDYFIAIEIANYLNFNIGFYDIFNFNNWDINISAQHQLILEKNYIKKNQENEHEEKIQKIKIVEENLNFLLDDNKKLVSKDQLIDIKSYYCSCCNSLLNPSNEIMHSIDSQCPIFMDDGIDIYNYSIFYHQKLNEIRSLSNINKIKFIFSPKDIQLLPYGLNITIPKYIEFDNVIINSVDEHSSEIDCIISVHCYVLNILVSIHIDLNEYIIEKEKNKCLDMKNCGYASLTYENYKNDKLKLNFEESNDCILNLNVIPSSDLKILLLTEKFKLEINFLNKKNKDYEIQKKLKSFYKKILYYKLTLYKRAKNIIDMVKNQNIQLLNNQLLIIKENDLIKRNEIDKIYKRDLFKRLQIHKERKSWNIKKYAHLKQQIIVQELQLKSNKQKIINYKILKDLEKSSLMLHNSGEQDYDMIENLSIKVQQFETIEKFILNKEFLFIKVDKIDMLTFYDNLSDENKKYQCVPFIDFNSSLFNNIITYINKKDLANFIALDLYGKRKFIDKNFNSNKYFIDNIIENNITEQELSFLNSNNLHIDNYFLENLDKILINLIIFNEKSYINDIKNLEIILKNNLEISKIFNVIDYFSLKDNFFNIYDKYFGKYNLYSELETKIKLLNSIKFKSDTILEEFILLCQSIKIRLDNPFLKNEYLTKNNKKALFLLSLCNDNVEYIKDNDKELLRKMQDYEIYTIKDVFKLSFGKIK